MQRDHVAAVCCAYIRKAHCAVVQPVCTTSALFFHQWTLPVNRTHPLFGWKLEPRSLKTSLTHWNHCGSAHFCHYFWPSSNTSHNCAMTCRWFTQYYGRPKWPAYTDVFDCYLPWRTPWCTVWWDTTHVDITALCSEVWLSVSTVNHTTSTDPTIWRPGVILTHGLCQIASDQSCLARLYSWGLVKSAVCEHGQQQTINHFVSTCPLTKVDYNKSTSWKTMHTNGCRLQQL